MTLDLSPSDIAHLQDQPLKDIRLPQDELETHQLLSPIDAIPLLCPYLGKRIAAWLPHIDSSKTIYCENGQPVIA